MSNQEITLAQILKELKNMHNQQDKAQYLQDVIAKLEQLKARLINAITTYKSRKITAFDSGVIFALKEVLGEEDVEFGVYEMGEIKGTLRRTEIYEDR